MVKAGHAIIILLLAISFISFQPAHAFSRCVLRTNCVAGEVNALSLYQIQDSHVRYDALGAYKICCPDYYSINSINDWGCAAGSPVANLYTPIDSHVDEPATTWFTQNTALCLVKPDSIPSTMGYTASDCRLASACTENEMCVLSLASSTDSHAAECGVYSNNICCCPSGYHWNGLNKCVPATNKCSDLPHDTFFCGQQGSPACLPTDYSKCCLNEEAVEGAGYSAWKTLTPTVYLAGTSLNICNQEVMCGGTNDTGQPDGICPNSISNTYALGFSCMICDSDCFGSAQCNGVMKGSAVCDSNCNPNGPFVNVTGSPVAWQNTAWTAGVACAANLHACDASTYKLHLQTEPGICSINYDEYEFSNSATINDHVFVCAAAKDTTGVAGFSVAKESLVDKTAPSAGITLSPNPPTVGENINFVVQASDDLSGLKKIDFFIDGVLKQTCNFDGNLSAPCEYLQSGYASLDTHSFYSRVEDRAGNVLTTSTQTFDVVPCDAADFEIISIFPDPAQGNDIVTITFQTNDRLTDNPAVTVTPGWGSYSTSHPAIYSSSESGRYVYNFSVSPAYPGGTAKVSIQGVSTTCQDPGIKDGFFNIISKRLAPALQIIPSAAVTGDTVYAVFSCRLLQGASESPCTDSNTVISDIRIVGEDEITHRFLSERGITNPNSYFHSTYVAPDNQHYSNVWAFPIETATYPTSTVTVYASYSGTSGFVSANYVVTSQPIPAASSVTVKVEFPDVTNNLVPLTDSGIPNFTRSMPVKIFASGIINKQPFGKEDCSSATCTAQWWIDGTPQAAMTFDAYNKAFSGTVSSSTMNCETTHLAKVNISVAGTPASGLSDDTFFYISCDPRVTVNPVESRVTVGDKGTKLFDVTIWNPRDLADYELTMTTVKSDDQNVLGWIEMRDPGGVLAGGYPPAFNVTVQRISSATSTVALNNDPGAGRSGAFGLKFTAIAHDTGKKYIAVGNMLIFAEGLDEFAAWQLVALGIGACVILLHYGHEGRSKERKNKYIPHKTITKI